MCRRRRRRGGHRSLGCVNRRRKSCLVKKPSLSRSPTHPLPHTLESRTHICASRCTHAHTLACVECLARMLGPEWHKTFLSGPGQGSQVLYLVGKPPDKPTNQPTHQPVMLRKLAWVMPTCIIGAIFHSGLRTRESGTSSEVFALEFILVLLEFQ